MMDQANNAHFKQRKGFRVHGYAQEQIPDKKGWYGS
jgi:hypothetical protein